MDWNSWLEVIRRSQGRIAPLGRMSPANENAPPGVDMSEWSRWLDTLRRNMGSSMSFRPDLPPANVNEVQPNMLNQPSATQGWANPWQDLLQQRHPMLPANQNSAPGAHVLGALARRLPFMGGALGGGLIGSLIPTDELAPRSMDEAPSWSWPGEK
jgi:hypothetical protein